MDARHSYRFQSQVKVLKNVRDGFKLVQERTLPSKTLIEVLIYVHFIGLEEKGQHKYMTIARTRSINI